MLTRQPSEANYYTFDSWWNWVKDNLIAMIFSKEEKVDKIHNSAIYKFLQVCKKDYISDKKDGVVNLGELVILVRELDWLQSNSPSNFSHFNRLLSSGRARIQSSLTGYFFELRVCNMLIQANYDFTRPDPPDFLIIQESNSIFVECYAPRVESVDNLYPKFRDNIISRKVKKYKHFQSNATKKCLFIDGTSIIRSFGQIQNHRDFVLPIDLERCLIEVYKTGFYDLIIFFFFGHTIEAKEDSSAVSMTHIPRFIEDELLKSFRDTLFNHFKEDKNYKIIYPTIVKD